ncbi:MAG: hypothetical protein JXB03_05725 [Spirochaetales bacterium]|nr:hypothetical protein [Spirochaetales bacterium]
MTRRPTILIPFQSGASCPSCQDIFVYLRPETNGIQVESSIMKVVQRNPLYLENMQLVYLANLPGDFMKEKRIVEHHYRLKIQFCIQGKRAFTQHMQTAFEIYYDEDFEKASVLGGFEALDILGMSAEQLSNLWVDRKNILVINGQSIKKYQDHYIINYDIPALIEKNDVETDIAVMVFRTRLGYPDVHRMIGEMGQTLRDEGLLPAHMPLARAFHYTKGPFEQINDAMGYLYNENAELIPLEETHFMGYLLNKGFTVDEIRQAVLHPIMGFRIAPTVVLEDNLLAYTFDDTYEDAMRKFSSIAYQMT